MGHSEAGPKSPKTFTSDRLMKQLACRTDRSSLQQAESAENTAI
jgi:hypothetical protein